MVGLNYVNIVLNYIEAEVVVQNYSNIVQTFINVAQN